MFKTPIFAYIMVIVFYVAIMVGGVYLLNHEEFNSRSPFVQIPIGK